MTDSETPSLQQLWRDGARAVLFYDGICGLCNHLVQFCLVRDRHRRLRFAPLQGETYERIFGEVGGDCIVVIRLDKQGLANVSRRTDAAFEVARHLGFPWRFAWILRIIPRFLRDTVYRLIAAVRYFVFGKFLSCRIPVEEERRLFLP